MAGNSYRDLLVWQKAMDVVTDAYRLSERFPRSEVFGLTSQLKRAIISVPSNIAEGQGRNSSKEFAYHLSVAYGSLMEAETQIQIAANLNYLDRNVAEEFFLKTSEIGRMLNGLSRSISRPTDNR
jgi:four helix bundle protein